MGRQHQLTHAEWGKVVLVAGIGSVLEWFDFYCYTQLNATLDKVFFPTDNESIQNLAFWGVYAAAFVVRPVGGIVFGHIGDTQGRNRCLVISIFCMAISTVAVGLLPTYGIAPYKAGVAASVMLALLRLVQGLAMGGEYGAALIYTSEIASPRMRGRFVGVLQLSAHFGMILATALVIALQSTLTERQMLVWGWRVPFLCSFVTALLGAALRSGMPEPHAFLTAARAANKRRSGSGGGGSGGGSGGGGGTFRFIGPPECRLPSSVAADVDVEVVASPTKSAAADGGSGSASGSGSDHYDERVGASAEEEGEEDKEDGGGVLSALHGHADVRTPILRLLRNNLVGLVLHVAYMSWVSGAFYVTVSWLAKDLRTYGYPLLQTQGLLIASLGCNAVGLFATAALIDRGLRVLATNAAVVLAGAALGFAAFGNVGKGLPAAWGAVCGFHVVIGAAMALVGLPCTRIYAPLERTTGFSFAYNVGYGIVGGLSPLGVAACKACLPAALKAFAAAFWLLALGVVSALGALGLRLYEPRLGRPFVGKIQ